MKRYQTRLRACVFTLSLTGLALSAPAYAESLSEALALAYQNNPSLEAQRAALRATDENVPQAKAGYRPTLQANGSVGKSESTGGTQSLLGSPKVTSTPRQGSISLNQPLFRGFSTTSNIKGANREVMAGRADLLSAEQDTLLNAVSAYMDVVRDEAVLALNDNQVDVLQRQLEASQNRFEVGEITRTDVAQSEARLSAAKSARISAEAQLTASRTAYQRIVGQMPGTLDKNPPLPPLPENEDTALTVAGENNPMLIAALYREEAARYSINSAAGALLPRVDLEASYNKSVNTFRSGLSQTSKQVTAQVTIPFYQGGAEYSRVRQAKQLRSQAQMQIIVARRTVEEQVRNAWISLRAAESTIGSARDTVQANEIALEGVRQEAEVGSRTTLEVLDAEQELLNARVELVRAERNHTVAGYTLLSAVGRLTAQNLELPVDYYDPAAHYDDVDNQWFGWGIDDGDD
jgi:TolC family type I secretion outer membrane protein